MSESLDEKLGCGDNSCVLVKPVGMGTNGGCRCPVTRVKRVMRDRVLEEAAKVAEKEASRVQPNDYPAGMLLNVASKIRALKTKGE